MSTHPNVPDLVSEEERRAATAPERAAERLTRPFERFARLQVAGGLLLVACTVAALAWANSGWAGVYEHLLERPVGLFFGDFRLEKSLHHWINDGLMVIFFFAVGLEIKREVLVGELARPRQAMLPIAAAIGGMAVPAALFLAFNAGGPGQRGWGVPMATDIAFALGTLTLLGRRVPESLKVFLVALAIVDDLGAVLVIAVFYSTGIAWGSLLAAGVLLGALMVANLGGARRPLVYLVLGAGVWYFTLKSGIHATVAGVLVAFTVPATVRVWPASLGGVLRRAADRLDALARPGEEEAPMHPGRVALLLQVQEVLGQAQAPLQRFERAVHPWVTFAIMPVFALFNAGVAVDGSALGRMFDPVPLGIVVGLVVGKQVGVFVAAWLAVKAGLASLPGGVSWRQVYAVAWLAGIGFTMSLFISDLAFARTEFASQAKLAILIGSLVAVVGGVTVALLGGARRADPA